MEMQILSLLLVVILISSGLANPAGRSNKEVVQDKEENVKEGEENHFQSFMDGTKKSKKDQKIHFKSFKSKTKKVKEDKDIYFQSFNDETKKLKEDKDNHIQSFKNETEKLKEDEENHIQSFKNETKKGKKVTENHIQSLKNETTKEERSIYEININDHLEERLENEKIPDDTLEGDMLINETIKEEKSIYEINIDDHLDEEVESEKNPGDTLEGDMLLNETIKEEGSLYEINIDDLPEEELENKNSTDDTLEGDTFINETKKEERGIYEINTDDHLEENVENEKDPDDTLEGDMLLTKEQKAIEDDDSSGNAHQNAYVGGVYLWPKNNGRVTIPYEITDDIKNNLYTLQSLETAMKVFSTRTCIDFYPRNPSDRLHFVHIKKGSGCYSYVGMVEDGTCKNCQTVSLGPGCGGLSTVQHELMHALGHFHEQARGDRDDYVTVKFENINWNQRHNFEIKRNIDISFGKYDLRSIMHYGGYDFSRNGKPTIIHKKVDETAEDKPVVANKVGISEEDLKKINAMYRCDDSEPSDTPEFPCEALAELGMCHLNYICTKCRVSCNDFANIRNKLDLKNLRGDYRCRLWKNRGYCRRWSRNFRYMSVYCHKECFHAQYSGWMGDTCKY